MKPGIIYGNAITFSGGFLLASKGRVDLLLFLATIIGLSLVIASGCAFNNYIDRDIDAKMERTKNRVLVKGLIPIRHSMIYATMLGMIGIFILAHYTNVSTTAIALGGFFAYVVLYSLWGKRDRYMARSSAVFLARCRRSSGMSQ